MPTKVLLVDDYLDALDTWRMFMEISGYEVITAADGRQAVDQAIEQQPDVIVMDLELPVLSGVEAALELQSRQETAHIPLIAATGYSNSRSVDAAKSAGFRTVLIKPCDPVQMLHEIERAVGGDRLEGGHEGGSARTG